MDYKVLIESRMDRLLNKKNELVDKYFTDGRLPTHREIMALRCLDQKYVEYAQMLNDFFRPGRTDKEERKPFCWEWRAQ